MSLDTLGELNWLAVIVGALAYWILGAIWYAKPVFGDVWTRASGVVIPEDQRPGPEFFVFPLIAEFLVTVAASMLAFATGSDTFGEGIALGIVLGIGVAMALEFVNAMFSGRPQPWAFFLVTGGYHLVGVLIVSVVVSVWT
jgi:hypothetical protein